MDAPRKQSSEATHCEVQNIGEIGQTSPYDSLTCQDPIGISPAKQGQESQASVLQKLGLLDQAFNPSSPSFDFQAWSQALVNLRNRLGIPTPPRSGFAFKNLTVLGSGPAVEQQDTVWTLLTLPFYFWTWFRPKETKVILRGLDGVVHKGELLLVLGRPGSGCSTFLKTVTGEMHSLELDSASILHYSGIPHQTMARRFKGELIYNQEVDEHLPYLTVGQTLEFAAAMRTPRIRLPGVTRKDRIEHVVQVVLTVFGLSHTINTIVGNDYVRGVSGGERKRVSIAETALSEAAISAWDNSTRGLDAESALHFVIRLRTLSDLTQSSNAAAIYQSSQSIVDLFDKILVLYEGRQIFFGRAASAPAYFERMGWQRHARQTSGDFMTAITNPAQRLAKQGHEDSVPRTPAEFEQYWRDSPEYASLMTEIELYQKDFSQQSHETQKQFESIRQKLKAKGMLRRAAQTVSFPMQTGLCAKRGVQQLWNDKASTLTTLIGEIIIALVVGSIFYGTPETSDAFFSYGSVLFFSVLLNVLMSVTDTHNLYKGRSVVAKQASYAFYRPSADALAGILVDVPVKFVVAVFFNVILYFLSGLARTASQFFIFFLFVFVTTLAMSMIFRTIAAATATLAQAMAISGFLVLALVTYTGFVLPGPYMHPWFKWISYINPLSYAFEALLVNQAHGTNYPCSNLVPPYQNLAGDTFVCPVPGSVAGETYVNGDAWFETSYDYSYSHLWRNLGIILGFLFFFLFTYLLASELNVNSSVGHEVPVFLRGRLPAMIAKADSKLPDRFDVERPLVVSNAAIEANAGKAISKQKNRVAFSWRKLSFEVMIKGDSKRLLDDACGWVKQGSLVALMGVSGAGKTTLLNALAQRLHSGNINGEFYVDGKPLPASFHSDVGYVQQQDVHLETSTVREALRFSAMLRQPHHVPKSQKLDLVEETIHLLDMDDFADAIVGSPGKGLNAEQRKRLSIGVELAGKPSLLLFLDEPTSGLDSQSSEAILTLLQKLAASGLGILCTIHQPSAMLFQRFDRLLLMARGGKVAYFGDIGKNSETVLGYFSDRASRQCKDAENPAEYLLDMIGNTTGEEVDWPGLWNRSTEANQVSAELERLITQSSSSIPSPGNGAVQAQQHGAYPVPMTSQLPIVLTRILQQYWRSTTYIASKFVLGIAGTLFIGFSFFQPGQSILGVQNSIFSILMVCAMFSSLVQQIMPKFVMQRTIYQVREQYSNMYSWVVLILVNILVEIPYHIILGVITFAIFNYTIFGIRSSEDQGLVLLFFIYFYILVGTFADMVIAALPDATTAGRVTTVLFSMMILFAGVFQTPTALPGFWIFMYRVSPMTYLVGGVAVSGLSGDAIVCSQAELAVFQPPSGETCGSYMQPYLEQGALGTLLNPDATSSCSYCPLKYTDQILARSD
ncbi:putative ABC1 transport protein [Fusarium austroafricanum]|uniref:Putative ABC1 transport protein n=1 Tax=Fusarium austroafricanum TaxID=2364996 RepID=A0A8H4JKX0_9HYPO|nr:putative ABC1 transport protein [Fusarium austroafricanum]